jgi:Saxitoxin biosynthesis operon protein SxtJ
LIDRADPSRANVRKFGLLFAAVCLVVTVLFAWKGNRLWVWTAPGVAFFLVTAFFGHPVLRPLYTGWMMFASLLAWINTRLLLGLFFYLVLTPMGLLLRLMGKDLLDRKLDPTAASYWVVRTKKEFSKEQYERLF